MAKTIDKIVQQSTAPKNPNVLWDNGENLKIQRNGVWENTNKTEVTEVDGEKIKDGSIPINALDDNIKDLLEALKPVQLSEAPPIGNVTQEQLDEIGLTEKVIDNILNGYTTKICINNSMYYVTMSSGQNVEYKEFTFASVKFSGSGIDSLVQYEYNQNRDGITIEIQEV